MQWLSTSKFDLESLIKEGWLFIGTADEHPLIVGDLRKGGLYINRMLSATSAG